MRTICLFAVVLLFVAVSACAQVGYGVEGGVGMATMKFAPSQYPIYYTSGEVSAVASYRVGALIDVPLSKHLTLQSGAYFSRKGAVRSFSYYLNDSFNENVHQTLLLHYASVPVMLVYKSGIQGRGRLIAGLGADVAGTIGGRNKLADDYTFNGTHGNFTDNTSISIGNTVRAFDIGLALMAGYELPTGLFFRITYTTGSQDIGKGTEISKNRTVLLSGGYIFGKGRNINKDKEANDLIDHTK
ncbi:MAG: outer membrane protein beta-barrel domain [Flavipsychrobacter sp.]|nr:outer membrane protein beta-barrel domain [Flavipsychrobacter sp.]